jgi:hydroxypyruvate reductase
MMEGISLRDFRGLLVAPAGRLPHRKDGRWTVLAGSHPIPDGASFAAGEALLDFAADPAFDAFLVGLSGGGSALAEAPLKPFFTRADLAACHRDLLASGLPIERMNAVRKRLSALKGGRLAAAMGERPAWTLLLSDVPAGHDAAVASGPTLPDPSTDRQVLSALRGLPERAWTRKLRTAIEAGRLPASPGRKDRVFQNKPHCVLADNGSLLKRAARELRTAGFKPRVLLANAGGRAETILPLLWRTFNALTPREAILLGGEFTVALPRRAGRGGRVSHLSLLFLERLLSRGCPFPFGFLGMATDGADGASGGAGVLLEGPVGTLEEVRGALAAHDSGAFFERHGRLLPPLRDGLNLRDCFVLWRAA